MGQTFYKDNCGIYYLADRISASFISCDKSPLFSSLCHRESKQNIYLLQVTDSYRLGKPRSEMTCLTRDIFTLRQSVSSIFPWSVYMKDVLIFGPKGDTIVYSSKVSSGIKPLALIKKKLVLKSVYLEKATINILRKQGEDQFNIASVFSGGNETNPVVPNTEDRSVDISLSDAEVRDVSFRFTDSVSGIYVREDVAMMKVVMRKMSLSEKTILAESLEIERATGSVTLNQKPSTAASDPGSLWNFGLGELFAENINLVFDDPVNRQKLDLLAGEIEIKAGETDISKKIIDIDKISVSGTTVVIRSATETKNQNKADTSGSVPFAWDIKGDLINLQEVAIQMLNYSDTADYNPLSGISIMGLDMKLSDLKINKNTMKAELKSLKFDMGNGFSLKHMDASLDSHSGSTRIDLGMETSNSRLNFEGLADKYIYDIISNPAGSQKASVIFEKN